MDYENQYKFITNKSRIFDKKIHMFLKGKKVLDVGCAVGEYLDCFHPDSLGLDLSTANVQEAQKKGLRVVQQDLNKVSENGLEEKFEAVFMSHILEHVDSPINLMRFAYNSLLPNGLLVLSVPNEDGIIHLKYPYYTGDGNHLYGFSENNMHELLKHSGFKQPTCYYDYQTQLSDKLKLSSLLQYLDVMPKFIKKKCSWAFWFVACKN